MQLPLSASAVLAHFDFGGGLVQVSSANTTPTVVSAYDQLSGIAATQPVVASRPTFAGSTKGVPSFYNSLAFNGTTGCLTFDSLAGYVGTNSAYNTSFTVYVVASTTVPATASMDLFSFGKTATDGYIQMFTSASKAGFSSKNDAAAVVAPATAGTVDTAVHLYTLVRDAAAGTIALRMDGAQIVSAAVTGNFSPSTCTIGALRNNSSTANFYNGNIFEVAVYQGTASITSIESYFSNKYLQGISREV